MDIDMLPGWLWSVTYDGASLPGPVPLGPGDTANCQRFAYGVLALSGRAVPPHRSSGLWEDPSFDHPPIAEVEPGDLVLLNDADRAYGAHVAIVLGPDRLLHLCREVGVPVCWTWADFAERDRYRVIVGACRVRPLPVPALLTELVTSGTWPGDGAAARRQNLEPLVPIARIHRAAPEERSLYLEPSPFPTLTAEIARYEDPAFWSEHGALAEIEPALALVIGDFGVGSDSLIVLDYRRGPEPAVLGLRWGSQAASSNHWVTIADTFGEFAELLGLNPHRRPG